ncbi:ethylene-responsive transcription factor-like protein At4g13040 [Aristolochia californica]|uniref:ethylene-responsive transcription factor-like protein At4g13040 n=1 Tax=Aristolochia californica TaxID=171875 RepID=UPI0035DF5B42
MVSLRRRRLLGLCPGTNIFLPQLPQSGERITQDAKWSTSASVHPRPSSDSLEHKDVKMSVSEAGAGSTNASSSSSPPKEEQSPQSSGREIKRRKRHRRKLFIDHEPCAMRGVYFKNQKWQAAIKVDKKQIHLGTVGTQEEAARLYDRAAFMCGREPNFELSEEEKQELRKFKWEEFLTFTRSAITSKKHKRRAGASFRKKSEPSQSSGDRAGSELSASEEMGPDDSLS